MAKFVYNKMYDGKGEMEAVEGLELYFQLNRLFLSGYIGLDNETTSPNVNVIFKSGTAPLWQLYVFGFKDILVDVYPSFKDDLTNHLNRIAKLIEEFTPQPTISTTFTPKEEKEDKEDKGYW